MFLTLLLWIEPQRVRFMGGFGKIFWVEEFDWNVPAPEPRRIALAPEGFHMRSEAGVHYIPLTQPCVVGEDVRQSMIELVRASAG